MSLEKTRDIWAARARRVWTIAWGLLLDLFWLAAVVVVVGAAIWTTARWAESTGRAMPWLSAAADYIQAVAVRIAGGGR